jgi:hypothetical protein
LHFKGFGSRSFAGRRISSEGAMDIHVRARFFLETATAVLGTGLAALTLLRPDWIERVFGAAPDGGSGLDEWLIVAGAFSIAIASALLARREWRARARSLLAAQRG